MIQRQAKMATFQICQQRKTKKMETKISNLENKVRELTNFIKEYVIHKKDVFAEFSYTGRKNNTGDLTWGIGKARNDEYFRLGNENDRVVFLKAGKYKITGFVYQVIYKDARYIEGRKNGVAEFSVHNYNLVTPRDCNNVVNFSWVLRAQENDYFHIYSNYNSAQYHTGRRFGSMLIEKLITEELTFNPEEEE